uniref:Claudin 4 n=1 Tax=Hucho hucho TaxID=62062 RepID=A0A4W5KUL7_9TELE
VGRPGSQEKTGYVLLGWVEVVMTCALPMWSVTAFIGATIITSQTIWEGIWMSCVAESTGQIQCKPYDSLLALSPDLQTARMLTVFAIVTGTSGLLLSIRARWQWFYSSTTDAQRREIGVCLYIVWGTSILLILGGMPPTAQQWTVSKVPIQWPEVMSNFFRYVLVLSL